jgi:hypothetical protein
MNPGDGFHWPDGVPKHVRIGPDRTFVRVPLTKKTLAELEEIKLERKKKRTGGM